MYIYIIKSGTMVLRPFRFQANNMLIFQYDWLLTCHHDVLVASRFEFVPA